MNKVSLWGLSPYIGNIIEMLRQSDIPIGRIVSDHATVTEIAGIAVESSELFAEHFSPQEPILVSSIASPEDDTALIHGVREIKGRLGLTGATVLHPVALSDLAKLDFSGKGLIIGANRSGSTLLFHVAQGILDAGGPLSLGRNETFIEQMAKNHFNTTVRFLKESFASEGAYYCGQGATCFGAMDVFGADHHTFYEMTPIPSRRYLSDRLHRCYSVIDASICQTVGNLNYVILTPLRNPLDIIVSNAFELEYVFFRMFPGEKLDRVESSTREDYGRFHLNNLEWFEQMAMYVKRNMVAWLQLQNHSVGIRYEALMGQPGPTMRHLAQTLHCDLSDDTLESIWKRCANKPLATFKAHFFRPGEGKWRTYLDRRHMDILKGLGYPQLLVDLGYGINFDTPLTQTPAPSGDWDRRMQLLLAIRDTVFNMQFQTQPSQHHAEVITLQANRPFTGLNFATNRIDYGGRFLKILTSDVYRALHEGLAIQTP
ncbi:MAG: sulfotransferase domain-containing protein [Nitrospirae bacterium]|nr:sulfotransferase domain-containing protein [Magnetococcales bacterium]